MYGVYEQSELIGTHVGVDTVTEVCDVSLRTETLNHRLHAGPQFVLNNTRHIIYRDAATNRPQTASWQAAVRKKIDALKKCAYKSHRRIKYRFVCLFTGGVFP